MTEPQDLFVFFAVSEVDPQLRPLNLVMNSLVKEFDPENGWGRYRGTVALVQRNGDEWFGSLDQEHRELIETKWRVALDATRAWQAQRNAETRGEGA
jgi:hypothetical protein